MTHLLKHDVNVLRTSGMSTKNPVDPSVPTAKATQNMRILRKAFVFIHGPKKTPMFEISTTKVTNPIP